MPWTARAISCFAGVQGQVDAMLAFQANNWNTPLASWTGVPTVGNFATLVCDTWLGVTCDGPQQNVIEIDLTSLPSDHTPLNGAILPAQVGCLTAMTTLRIIGFELGGVIPSELGAAGMVLEQIELNNNWLNSTIPTDLGSIATLEKLELRHNYIVDPIPLALYSAVALQVLDVSSNLLAGALQTEIGLAIGLLRFDISNNDYSAALPTEIGSLTDLTYLGAANNAFSGGVPTELGNCPLQVLKLQNNVFSSITDDIYNVDLDYLDIGSNLLTVLPEDLFGTSSQNLSYVDISNNQFTGSLPTTVGYLNGLNGGVTFDASSNTFDGTIPSQVGNANMVYFDVSNNQLSGEIPTTVNGWENAGGVFLFSANKLDGSIPTQFSALDSINTLDIANNKICGDITPTLDGVTVYNFLARNNKLNGTLPEVVPVAWDFIRFDVRENKMSGTISAAFIADYTSSTDVLLGKNNFGGTLPTEVGLIGSNLNNFDISHNGFDGTLPSELGLLTAKRLNVNNNAFTGPLPSEIIHPGVQILHVGGNMLSGGLPPASLFLAMTNPREIDVSSNAFTGALVRMRNPGGTLRTINANNNLFSGSFPEWLTDTTMRVIKIGNNSLTGTLPSALYTRTALRTLEIHRNEFSGSIGTAIGNMGSLQTFYAHSNDLTGPLPVELSDLSSTLHRCELAGNNFNCPLPNVPTPCDVGALYGELVCGPNTVITSVPTTTVEIEPQGLSTGAIVSIAVGASVLGVAAFGDLLWSISHIKG